ncbi:MAG: histidine phosphatase family protein [Actinomycetota bacterium]
MMRTLVHLVRHAEVENPENIWYGRLDGFVLSERGLRQTKVLGDHFSDRKIEAVYSSPLTRAIQTAEAIALPHGIQVQVEEQILESEARLQGWPGDRRLFRNPLNARHFLNPLRPSWGEPYASTRSRMTASIRRMATEHEGGEAVAVSHMTPVLVCRLSYEKNPRPPWLAKIPCARASVTTLKFEDGEFAGTEYHPVGSEVV